jgi:hypothetical protein
MILTRMLLAIFCVSFIYCVIAERTGLRKYDKFNRNVGWLSLMSFMLLVGVRLGIMFPH